MNDINAERTNPFFTPYDTLHNTVPFDKIKIEDYEEAFMEGIRRDDEEIDKMVKEAEANKEKDAKRKEEADVKNELEQLVFATEKAIKDLGDKITDKEKSEAEDAVKVAKEAMDSNDLDKMKDAKEKLNEKAMALGSKVYEEAAKTNQANAGATSESTDNDKKDDSVVDADYEEK